MGEAIQILYHPCVGSGLDSRLRGNDILDAGMTRVFSIIKIGEINEFFNKKKF
ncbi:hypothetical protein [Candidatus Tisiphia endosymbiont of Nemotelus uliginosus]|uniref:hypothetical protein n=1 Tax=Candidatus Tisiphia endosymbiont of Nemotelus uliginosus TaxID=3077926 RepID=UPI0035C8C6CF